MERFLTEVRRKKVRLNIRKTQILATTINWCGREISKGTWRFDPRFFSKILHALKPRYAHELAQCIYIATWLAPSIPSLTFYRQKFSEVINLRGGNLKQLTKKQVDIRWTDDMNQHWQRFMKQIYQASRTFLKNYDVRDELLVLMDASEDLWSLVLCQTTSDRLDEDYENLAPRPMIFLSGAFKGSDKY